MGGNMSLKDCTGRQKDDMRLNIGECELTEREKELVRTTWAKLADKQDGLSVDIFLRIFELIPIAKELFPFKNAVGDALIEHPYLKGHAMRFFNAVGMTVLNLDAWEVILIPNLMTLGRQHANIQGFKHEYFESFAQAMNDVFKKYLGPAYTTETRRAWTKISSLITRTVEQGYREGQEINIRRSSHRLHPDSSASIQNTASITCPMTGSQVCPMDIDQIETRSKPGCPTSTGMMSLEQTESQETDSMQTSAEHKQSYPVNSAVNDLSDQATTHCNIISTQSASPEHQLSCPVNNITEDSFVPTTTQTTNGITNCIRTP